MIYKFFSIFSEYKCRENPTREKYQNSFLCVQQLITALEITYLKIMMII